MHGTVTEMLTTAPKGAIVDDDSLASCIAACFDCSQTCVACADACLGEDEVTMLVRCIRLNLDCADVCANTGHLLTRQLQPDQELLRRSLELCQLACEKCAEECERHADQHDHCRICAKACRSCQDACEKLLAALDTARPEAQH